jgi:DNA-binding Lrp family transcriptional regulator
MVTKELFYYMNKKKIAQNSNCEEKILNELEKNCRLNLDEIGKKCDCSRYKVSRYIKKLEDNKTILGYSAIINPHKTNLKHYILLIKRTNLPLEEDLIKKLPVISGDDIIPDIKINLNDTLYVHGNYDWVITFKTNDISNAKDFCNKILKFFNKFVESLELLETVAPIRINGFKIPKSEIPKIL